MTYSALQRPISRRRKPDEQQTIDGIIQGMTQQSPRPSRTREHHAVRASHAKSTRLRHRHADDRRKTCRLNWRKACSRAGRHVRCGRCALRKGRARRWAIACLPTAASSIKVFGVEGEKLPGHDAPIRRTSCWRPVRTFPSGTAKGFLRDGDRRSARRPPLPERRQERRVVEPGAQPQQGARARSTPPSAQGGLLRPPVQPSVRRQTTSARHRCAGATTWSSLVRVPRLAGYQDGIARLGAQAARGRG